MANIYAPTHKVTAHDGEFTNGSGSSSGSASGYSDLTGLENETDELGRKILQHQRDARRLNQAVHGEQHAFRQWRAKDPIADLLARRAERHDLSDGRKVESEPPVTVPQDWGRGARRSASWMRKIQEPSEPDLDARYQGQTVHQEINIIHARQITSVSNERNRRGRVVDSQPLILDRRANSPAIREVEFSPPSSMRHMNTTLLPDLDSDDHDLSNVSLLASTPARSKIPRRIDEVVARREIEDAKQGAAASKSSLSRPHKRRSDAKLDRISDREHRESAIGSNLSRSARPLPTAQSTSNTSSSRIPRRTNSPGLNKENLPPGRKANEEYKDEPEAGLRNRTSQPLSFKTAQRNAHHREDSLGLLRKLARIPSMSPSPARQRALLQLDVEDDVENLGVDLDQDVLRAIEGGEDGGNAGRYQDTEDSRPSKSDYAPKRSKESESRRLLRDRGNREPQLTDADRLETANWNDPPSVVPAARKEAVKSRQSEPVGGKQDAESRKHASNTKAASQHPRSALDSVVRDSKAGETSREYGDSTMQSLEDMVRPNLEPSDPTFSTDLENSRRMKEQEAQLKILKLEEELTQTEMDRRQETLAMEALNKHLQAAQSSIKDANRGLRRVENRIETAHEEPVKVVLTNSKPKATLPSSRPSESVICTTCSRPQQHSSVWWSLWTEFRELFYTWTYPSPTPTLLQPQTWPRPQPTILGLTILIPAIWLLIEMTLCWRYCHPLYAIWSDFPYGIDPNAPDFPFVIPTLLFRPLRWLWGPPMETLLASVAAFWTNVSSGKIGSAANAAAGSRAYASSSSSVMPSAATAGVRDVRGVPLEDAIAAAAQSRAGSTAVFEGSQTAAAVGAGYNWVGSSVQAAKETATRIVQSVVDAVDEIDWMWDDDLPVFS